MLLALLIGTLNLASRVEKAKASGTIYIRADGSIDPPDAPISTADNVTYTFVGNISDSIVVERDNIVVDGAGYIVEGTGSGNGTTLSGRTNITIRNTTIKTFYTGIYLFSSNNNSVLGNNITANNVGVWLKSSNYNSLSGNNITNNNYRGIGLGYSSNYNSISDNNATANNQDGIGLYSSSNNSISGNSITANNYDGIYLYSSSGNSVSGNNITNNGIGVFLGYSSNYSGISGNNITNNVAGIDLDYSSNYNSISDNNITANHSGILLYSSSNNSISGNNVTANNHYGIWLDNSSINLIYHNSFIDNTKHAHSYGSVNVWDVGYPSGGNYWSNYTGVDEKSGSSQDESGSDGIGDTPYIIDANNIDHYPLMGTFRDFTVHPLSPTHTPQSIIVISNSTVTDFADYYVPTNDSEQSDQLVQLFLEFSVTGQNGATGFCRLQIPKVVMNSSLYMVLVDYKQVNATQLPNSNDVTEYLYFTYIHSTHQVWVFVPEFPSYLILPLFFITTLLAVIICKRTKLQKLKSLICTATEGQLEVSKLHGYKMGKR